MKYETAIKVSCKCGTSEMNFGLKDDPNAMNDFKPTKPCTVYKTVPVVVGKPIIYGVDK